MPTPGSAGAELHCACRYNALQVNHYDRYGQYDQITVRRTYTHNAIQRSPLMYGFISACGYGGRHWVRSQYCSLS